MNPMQAQYNPDSRTVTPGRGQAVTTQSWKKVSVGHDPRLIAQEARTASPTVNAGRSFGKVLADEHRTGGPRPNSFEGALAMSDPAPAPAAAAPSSFSFDDFIDIVNPLQHIPVVNLAYRELTGDKIGPVAQIIGGGIFGGPVGAISGTANAVIQETTGKDIAGNVLALVVGEDGSYSVPDSAPASIDRNNPEMALSLASARYTGEQYVPVATAALPSETAMGFAQMREATAAYEKAAIADGRTAGWMAKEKELPPIDVDYTPAKITLEDMPAREPITVLPITPTFGGIY